jgi:hypothetical protein
LILAAGPVGLFPGPFDFQLGLAETEVSLGLELVQSGPSQVDLGGGQGCQEEAFHLGIYPVGADGLTDRSPLVLVGPIAAIDPVLSLRSAIMHGHALAAPAAADQALQQSLAGAFQSPATGLEALLIGGQAFLVGEILVPGEIGRVDVVEEHFPLVLWEVNAAGVRFLRMGFFGAVGGFAVGVGAGVGGVFEEALEGPLGGLAPQELAPLGTGKRAVREEELGLAEIAEESAERANVGEPGEDISEALPDSLVGVEGDGAIGLADQADGQREGQFSPQRLVLAGGGEAAPEEMQFGFGEGNYSPFVISP